MLTRALQSSPFQISGGYPERDGRRTEEILMSNIELERDEIPDVRKGKLDHRKVEAYLINTQSSNISKDEQYFQLPRICLYNVGVLE